MLSEVSVLAERHDRPVRLLVVPAHDVFGAIVATILRLRSSDVHVGESSTLSADEQARLLGEAWEKAARAEPLDVRLVVHHRSGRTDTYHLGAHPPSLSPGDLDLIHRVWLDATKAIGPHVHHHDVVRAALTQMEQQLNGQQRDDALGAIRQTARRADELTPVLRARDYAQLRDMMRNRHAVDVATLLTELSLEDQVVVFRVLPRKDAAAVFEYLSQDAKETLLKAMAQDDVAALLNNMAPDDRTMFLEELPATATRELLTLLTPEERAVAMTLLGYPERSVGRLMTPHYVAVREHWTVRDVLDYVRKHGQDSETLNVIYVVDEQGLLIDDVRIREFLLAPVEHLVADLMDRRFVALKASDDQEEAVAVFRQYDRVALPVTDTAGMLIGIVTIDDVLDVAEATATREIQRIGGSEALDEPYMEIAFGRMIQKRAGWLTALFLGEMLTATAMGAFEAEISKAVVLALFVPLIISSGGNSGSQAATLVIRALALGEVGLRDWWRVMRRELMAGLALGGILGGIGFLRIALWSAFSDMYGAHWLLIAITVAISLVGVVLWGTLTGSLLPLVMRRLGFDPAASSAPFVATLVDVTGLVIYFTVAMVVLRGTLCCNAGAEVKVHSARVSRIHRGTRATARSGPPDPPSIFIGSAMTTAPRSGQPIEVGQVLESRDVARRRDPMDLEVGRAAVVDRRGVDAERGHAALLDEQPRRVGTVRRERQLRGVARRVVAEIRLRVRPVPAPTRPQQHDRAARDRTVRLLELQHVVARQAVVAVLGRLRGHVDDHRRRHELLERDLLGRAAVLREVMRRVEVGSAVLGRAQRAGGIEEAAGGRAAGLLIELELRRRRRPVERARHRTRATDRRSGISDRSRVWAVRIADAQRTAGTTSVSLFIGRLTTLSSNRSRQAAGSLVRPGVHGGRLDHRAARRHQPAEAASLRQLADRAGLGAASADGRDRREIGAHRVQIDLRIQREQPAPRRARCARRGSSGPGTTGSRRRSSVRRVRRAARRGRSRSRRCTQRARTASSRNDRGGANRSMRYRP